MTQPPGPRTVATTLSTSASEQVRLVRHSGWKFEAVLLPQSWMRTLRSTTTAVHGPLQAVSIPVAFCFLRRPDQPDPYPTLLPGLPTPPSGGPIAEGGRPGDQFSA